MQKQETEVKGNKKYYTIKILSDGAFHICYKKMINGVEYYVAPNHFNKWKVNSDKIKLIE